MLWACVNLSEEKLPELCISPFPPQDAVGMCEPVRGRVLEPCRGHQVSVKFDASLQFVHLGQEQPRNKAVFLGVGGLVSESSPP